MIDHTPPPAIVIPAPQVQTEEQFYDELMKLIHQIVHIGALNARTKL